VKRIALASAALLLLLPIPAHAASKAKPGDACEQGVPTNSFGWTSGQQRGGVSDGMFCNTGGTYTGIINFQSTGNVGIGTTSPTNLLTMGAGGWNSTPRQAIQILDQGYAEPTADATDSDGDKLVLWNEAGFKHAVGVGPYELWFQASGNSSGHITFWTGPTSGVAPSERMRIDSAGYVGIGTPSPSAFLHVYSNAGSGAPPVAIFQRNNATCGASIEFFNAAVGTDGWGIKNSLSACGGLGNLYFIEKGGGPGDGTERITFQAGGNVGIGTTSPQATLDIQGYARLKPYSSQPVACSSTYNGAIALTAVYTTCVCKGSASAWYLTSNGTTACTW
jgi:hypothetical protein